MCDKVKLRQPGEVQAIPPGKDDHMIADADLYRSFPPGKLLPGTLAWLRKLRSDVERSYGTRVAAGLTDPSREPPPRWTWNLE